MKEYDFDGLLRTDGALRMAGALRAGALRVGALRTADPREDVFFDERSRCAEALCGAATKAAATSAVRNPNFFA